ncbi:MAG: hypothetical protein ACHQ4H_05855 [Ktedonobacterales bacterium]
MSEPNAGNVDDPFVITPLSEHPHDGDAPLAGGSQQATADRRALLSRQVANPDDPPVRRPPQGRNGPMPGPNFTGSPGRVAIVQGQVYLVGVILVAQLFLVTTALYELLSGRPRSLWLIAGLSLAGFLIALLVAFWPRRRTLIG